MFNRMLQVSHFHLRLSILLSRQLQRKKIACSIRGFGLSFTHDPGISRLYANWNVFSWNSSVQKVMNMLKALFLTGAMLVPVFAWCEDTNAPVWRDPFWPVGYVPVSARKVTVEKPRPTPKPSVAVKPKPVEPPKPVIDWIAARRMLKVAGYAEGNGVRSCFINGRLVSEGETVSLVKDRLRYTWRVTRIDRDPLNRKFEDLTVLPAVNTK